MVRTSITEEPLACDLWAIWENIAIDVFDAEAVLNPGVKTLSAEIVRRYVLDAAGYRLEEEAQEEWEGMSSDQRKQYVELAFPNNQEYGK